MQIRDYKGNALLNDKNKSLIIKVGAKINNPEDDQNKNAPDEPPEISLRGSIKRRGNEATYSMKVKRAIRKI